jgi:hypothetical protein
MMAKPILCPEMKPSSTGSRDHNLQMEEIERQNSNNSHPSSGGYARLAEQMAHHPELAIFRRFSTIGMEAMLFQQAQLAALESRYRVVQARNRVSNDDAGRLYDHSWEHFGMSGELDPEDERREQYDILNTINVLKLTYGTCEFQNSIN